MYGTTTTKTIEILKKIKEILVGSVWGPGDMKFFSRKLIYVFTLSGPIVLSSASTCFSFSFSSRANPLWSISYNHFSFPLIVDLFYWNFTWQALCNFSDCGVSWFFFFPKVCLDSCLCNQTCYIRFCKCDPLKGF